MNTTLAVVVSAIVILITALVVITMFGNSMVNVGSLTEAKSFCSSVFATSCRVTGTEPAFWRVSVNGQPTECRTQVSCTCSSNNPTCT